MAMIQTPLKILAINPGWRYLGIAVFADAEPMEWRLKGLKGKGIKKKLPKLREILSALIEFYHPTILSIKKLHPSRSSANLDMLAAEIKSFCRRRGLKVFSYSIQELEAFFGPAERINKKRLAEMIVSECPALADELKRERRNRNPYFIRLFEAVAIGLVCYHQNRDIF
jgi:Holliday junction resolvasome RuvABC endonuclease subunit